MVMIFGCWNSISCTDRIWDASRYDVRLPSSWHIPNTVPKTLSHFSLSFSGKNVLLSHFSGIVHSIYAFEYSLYISHSVWIGSSFDFTVFCFSRISFSAAESVLWPSSKLLPTLNLVTISIPIQIPLKLFTGKISRAKIWRWILTC